MSDGLNKTWSEKESKINRLKITKEKRAMARIIKNNEAQPRKKMKEVHTQTKEKSLRLNLSGGN